MICLSKNELTVRVNIDALLGASLLVLPKAEGPLAWTTSSGVTCFSVPVKDINVFKEVEESNIIRYMH